MITEKDQEQQQVASKYFNEGLETEREYLVLINLWSELMLEDTPDIKLKRLNDIQHMIVSYQKKFMPNTRDGLKLMMQRITDDI